MRVKSITETETEKIVKNYISLCEQMEQDGAYGDAMDLIEEITDSLYGRIPNVLSGLYHYDGYHDDTEVSAVSHDLRVMKTKLRCYLDDLKQDKTGGAPAAPMINNNNYFEQQISVNLSFEQVIKSVQEIPKLSDDEKKKFEELLKDVRDNTQKESAWKHVLSFLADKGMDVIIATLHYLQQILSQFHLLQGH